MTPLAIPWLGLGPRRRIGWPSIAWSAGSIVVSPGIDRPAIDSRWASAAPQAGHCVAPIGAAAEHHGHLLAGTGSSVICPPSATAWATIVRAGSSDRSGPVVDAAAVNSDNVTRDYRP